MNMKLPRLAISVVLLFAAGFGVASAKTRTDNSAAIRYSHADKATVSGHRIRLLDGLALNPDCSVLGDVALKVVAAPSHGQDTPSNEDIFPSFQPPDPRAKCDDRKFPGITIYYTPAADFIGRDMTEIQVSYPTGVIYDIKIDIDVK